MRYSALISPEIGNTTIGFVNRESIRISADDRERRYIVGHPSLSDITGRRRMCRAM